jgi:phospholipid/cholesterol/gamma-HCH transport system permease protein
MAATTPLPRSPNLKAMSALMLERQESGWRLALNGDWSLGAMPVIEAELDALPPLAGAGTCDWSGASNPSIGTAWLLLTRLMNLTPKDVAITHAGAPPMLGFLQHLDVQRRSREAEPGPAAPAGFLGRLGRWTYVQGIEARGVLDFFGRIVAVISEVFKRPQALRLPSLARHIYETGVTAIPIVSLIAFLISVIVAYLGAQQLSQFGATIFVVDLVTISVLREMGVLLTAIIVAGRSGSAFAAELGVMQLNEETDALRAMGMNPIEVLVLPRILALVIAMPLLTVLADAMGLAGGGLLSLVNLHIPLPQFMNRLREALAPTTFWSGIIKAPVFAALIGVVGAYRGMQVRDSARELGRLTTVAVVQSIFMVILADALFAVLFMQLDF